jgi:hypothetical protein
MLLEYLINLNTAERNEDLSEQSEQSEKPALRIKDIENIQKFVDNHGNILTDGTTRAIFATGVCVGILLEVQEELYSKSVIYLEKCKDRS